MALGAADGDFLGVLAENTFLTAKVSQTVAKVGAGARGR